MTRFAIAALLSTVAFSPASADVLYQSRQVSYLDPDGRGISAFAAFDGALGTLTGIRFAFDGDYTSRLFPQLYADTDPSTAVITTGIRFDLIGASFQYVPATKPIPFNAQRGLFDVNYHVTQSFDLSPTVFASALAADGTPFNRVDYTVGSVPNIGGTGYFQQAGLFGFSSLTYTYTPAATAVPEPSTLALLGVGMVAMWGRRRMTA